MMKKLCFLLIILIFNSSIVFGQELFLRKDNFFTEVYLKVNPKTIKSVEKGTGKVVITFSNSIKKPFSQQFDDKFIKDIQGSGSQFTVNIKPDSEYSIVNDINGIKVIATKAKSNKDILSRYDVAKPMLSTESQELEDKNIQLALEQADRLIAGKQFPQGAEILNNILSSTKNEYYRQEALFKLGQTYMLMGQYDALYYSNAYNTFDDFAKKYPDNIRVTDALLKSAEAKETANQLFDAINTYRKIYNSVTDLETKRFALKKMAELYKKLGQFENAVATYNTYLRQFKTDTDFVNGEIGQIYYDLKEYNLAFEYFSAIDTKKLINDPETTLERLHAVADVMYKKNRYNSALPLYQAIYEKYPDDPKTSEAIFRSADILQKTGRQAQADNLMIKLKESYPEMESGQKAAIEYAEKYLNTKPYEYWNKHFADILNRPDKFGYQETAKYMLIKTLYRENRMNEAVNMITSFLGSYPKSKHFDELNKIKEDYLFSQISETFGKKDYLNAEKLITSFTALYPKSQYMPRIDIMLNDIAYYKIDTLYKNKNYKEVINQAKAHLQTDSTAKFNDKARWSRMLDDALYADLNITFGSKDYPASRAAAKEYLNSYQGGSYRAETSSILEKSILKPMETSFNAHDYPAVIQLYDSNSDILADWKNKKFTDKVKTMVGLSVYRLGSPSKARLLYSEITPDASDTNYAILGLVLGDKNLKVDINAFDKDTFKYIAGEVEQLDTDMAVNLLDSYTRDKKFAMEMKYALAKNIPSDAKRQQILMNIYDTIRQDPKSRFANSEDVYMDMGLIFFRKNDYKNAVLPLKQFTDIHKTKDDKRAEALYYLGKSFINMGDVQRGYQYYNDIINNIPSSIYAGLAKGEMEEDSWRKNLNNY